MNERKQFFQFVIPSVLAFALSGVYTIVDGFFVGQSIGDLGLAAITLGYPVTAFLQAAGTGIGLSGAIRFTILQGQKKTEESAECAASSVLLLFLAGVVLTGGIGFFLEPLLTALGAEGETFLLTRAYVEIIILGTLFQVFATGLVPFIRNLGGAAFAMGSMTAGFLTNILLDYLFVWVFGWGMAGAAWATVIGQGVTMAAAVGFLWYKRIGFRIPDRRRFLAFARRILKISAAPFGLTFSPQITTILMNRYLLSWDGELAVAAYGCIAYITAVVYLLLQGVGDGSQPLISQYYSEGAGDSMNRIRRLAYLTSGGIALASMIVLFLAREWAGALFGASAETNQQAARYLPWFLSALLFLSYVRITTAFFYATEKGMLSYLLVYGEPVFLFVLLPVLPAVGGAGVAGVWAAVPLAQFATWLLAVAIHRTWKGIDFFGRS